MAKKKHSKNKWLKVVLGLVTAFIIIAGVFTMWLQGPGGRSWVAGKIEAALAVEGGSATIGELTGNPLGRFELHGVSLTDLDGEWLAADRIAVDWKPFSILFGAPEIVSLASESLALERLPLTPEKPDDEGGFTPPALEIGAVDIAFLTPLGAEPGTSIRYRLSGLGIKLGESHVIAKLLLEAEASAGDRLDVSVAWRKGKGTLDLAASFEGAKGGVIETLLGLKGAGPIAADLKGQGPIATWTGAVTFSLGSGWALDATLAGVGEETLETSGALRYPPSREDPWTSLLGTESRFNGTIGLDDLLRPAIDVAAAMPGGTANLKGVVNPKGGQLLDGLRFDIEAPRVVIPGAAGEAHIVTSLLATGRLAGAPARPLAEGDYSFAGITSPVLSLGQTGGSFKVAPWRSQLAFALTGKGARFGVQIGGDQVRSPVVGFDLGGLVDNEMRTFDFDIHSLDLSQLTLAGRALFDLQLTPQTFDLAGTLASGMIGDIAGAPGWAGESSFSAVFDGHSQMVTVRLGATGFSAGRPIIDALMGPTPKVRIEGRLIEGGGFEMMTGRLAGDKLDLAMSGIISGSRTLGLDYVAGFSTLEGVAPEAFSFDGPLVVTGKITGPADNAAISAATRIADADIGGLAFRDMDVTLRLQNFDKGPAGSLAIAANSPFGAFQAASGLAFREDGSIFFENIAAELSAFLVNGNLEIATGGAQGKLTGRFGEDELLLAGGGLRGVGSATFDFDIREGVQHIVFRSDLADIRARESSGLLSEIKAVAGSGDLVFREGGPEGRLDLAVTGLFRGALAVEQVSIKGTLGKGASLTVTGDGTYYDPFAFTARAVTLERTEGFALAFDIEADYGGRPLETLRPVTFEMEGDAFSIDIPNLRIGDGLLTANYRTAADGISLSATANELDAVLLTLPWRGLVSSGILSGEVSFTYLDDSESLEASLYADGLRHQGLFDIEEAPFSLGLRATGGGGRFEVETTLVADGADVGTLSAEFAYDRADGLRIVPNKPLSAGLVWDGPVEPLWALSRLYDHDLTGRLVSNVAVAGTLDNPVFSGTAKIAGGEYAYLPSGLTLTDISLDLAGAGDKLRVRALDAADGSGGTVHLEGEFEISPRLTLPGTLALNANNLRFVRLDNIDARASGNLSYTRTEQTASLEGAITTGRIEAEISQRLPKSVVKIEVREINRPGAPERQPLNGTRTRAPVNLNLEARIPNQFFVRGRGLESEWSGSLAIAGTSDRPLIGGTLDLVRGYFDFAGKRFTFDSGRLVFDGGAEVDPDLMLVSRTRTPSIDAEIRISGKLSSPQLTMSSTPVLPEDEILANLLFGKSIQDLSALQLAELASALATVSGGGGGFNVLSTARKGLGLDILSFTSDPDQESGTLITGGKYLTRDVYLEIETATATGETITRLLYDITRRFRAESEVSQKKGSSLKIKWFRDY